jgi:prepilin-type N-terminal cleavage/methylation domain-containing protein
MLMNLPAQTKTRKAFTLIELLVVIGVLAVLLTIVLIAINPARQFSQSNDTKRRSDVNALLNAVHQYAADHKGLLPGGAEITTAVQVVNSTTMPTLCSDLVTDYLAALPVDPLTNNGLPVASCSAAAWDTNYTITRSAGNSRITVAAPAGELDAAISVTR